jgi:hypothetical protein
LQPKLGGLLTSFTSCSQSWGCSDRFCLRRSSAAVLIRVALARGTDMLSIPTLILLGADQCGIVQLRTNSYFQTQSCTVTQHEQAPVPSVTGGKTHDTPLDLIAAGLPKAAHVGRSDIVLDAARPAQAQLTAIMLCPDPADAERCPDLTCRRAPIVCRTSASVT